MLTKERVIDIVPHQLENFKKNIAITAAFTGPRPKRFHFKDNEHHPDCELLKKALKEHILLLYHEFKVRRYLSGVSTGVDMWAAELVLELKNDNPDMELYSIIPCFSQADRWSKSHQLRYSEILKYSTDRVYISKEYHDGCNRERNRFLVAYSRHLVAVDDFPKPAPPRSGTRMTVNMGAKNGNRLWLIPTGIVTGEHVNDF